MSPSVVVFAIGNPSRGDDALGPTIHGRLAEWLENAGLAAHVELFEDFQLNIEHALDLVGRELALFIDAGAGTPSPFDFYPVNAQAGLAHTSHALPPHSVLQVFKQTMGGEPPPAFVLCVRGEQFVLGAPLSDAAQANAEAAIDFLVDLFAEPSPAKWQAISKKVRAGRAN